MKEIDYYQVKLVKDNIRQVCCIPAKYAIVGKQVKIKKDEEWDCGWVVAEVYNKQSHAPDTNKAIRNHRRSTGDSLPKEQ